VYGIIGTESVQVRPGKRRTVIATVTLWRRFDPTMLACTDRTEIYASETGHGSKVGTSDT